MRILGIESSCDDTSVALVEKTKAGFKILSEKTASQIDIHKAYGGVVPEIAARAHADAMLPIVEEVLKNQKKPDCIAVTAGPGLITSLLVGVETAKTLSYLLDIPLVAVNHIEGHIHSVELSALPEADSRVQFPALCLVVSGGHTELILMRDHSDYERIGKTLDDAAGECFDKVAKLVDFDYPGGPKISKAAESGDPNAISFPRPMLDQDNFNFSFAGLKTSALYWLRDHEQQESERYTLNAKRLSDFCASFEQSIVDVLVAKTLSAASIYNPKSILLVGGVSANKKLRETLGSAIQREFPSITYRRSPITHAMDNAAMIAAAGSYAAERESFTPWRSLAADPNWILNSR